MASALPHVTPDMGASIQATCTLMHACVQINLLGLHWNLWLQQVPFQA